MIENFDIFKWFVRVVLLFRLILLKSVISDAEGEGGGGRG